MAERTPLMAPSSVPSVPFLKPMGVEMPLEISRCVWASAVRAPMTFQEMRSPMYCGMRTSRSSVPDGRPISATRNRKCRAMRMPSSMWKVSFM